MSTILAALLALLTLEGLILVSFPTHVRAFIRETSDVVLRVAGIVEIIIVLVIVVVLKLL